MKGFCASIFTTQPGAILIDSAFPNIHRCRPQIDLGNRLILRTFQKRRPPKPGAGKSRRNSFSATQDKKGFLRKRGSLQPFPVGFLAELISPIKAML